MNPVVIGNATLYLGDCMDILPTLPKVDAVITDPPFGIADAPITLVDRADGKRGPRGGRVNTWHAPSTWDKELDPRWLAVALDRAAVVALFGQWRKRGEFENAAGMPARAEIVWAKDTHVGAPCPVAPRDERIWIFSASGVKGATFETSVWDHPVIPSWAHKEHKNEKPVSLMGRLIRWIGPSVCCDPFMGSGSTGVAAVQAGIKFIGVERDEQHFATAIRRIEEAQRQQPLIPHEPPKAEQISLIA